MTESSAAAGWTPLARLLHWLMAAMILAQYVLGWIADEMERSPAKAELMTGHKSLGITVLLLLLLRACYRYTHPAPPPPPRSGNWEIRASRWAHGALYFLMAAVPLSGWLAASTSKLPWKYWWLFEWPRLAGPDRDLHRSAENLHALLFWALLILLALHVAAALRHHFLKKNDVLRRMLSGQ